MHKMQNSRHKSAPSLRATRFTKRASRSRHKRRSLLTGRSALRKWIQAEARASLSTTWGVAHAPEASLDIGKPRWLMILSTFPDLLPPSKRPSCDMLMGLAAHGAAPTDWNWVMERARNIFDLAAEHSGQATRLHVSMGHARWPSPADEAGLPGLWCGGRCHIAMPAYGLPRFYMLFSEKTPLFDRRRALRRIDKSTPSSWISMYGQLADQFWLCGLSRRREVATRFDNWTRCVASMAHAMAETGLDTRLCEGFFAEFPQAMDDRSIMEQVDQSLSDGLRSRWVIEQCALGAPRASQPAKRGL